MVRKVQATSKPRPFDITTRPHDLSMLSTVVSISVINRSKQHRLILHLTLYIPLSNGQEYPIDYGDLLTLEPEQHFTQELSFIPKAPPFGPLFLFHDAYLLVYDKISHRSGKVQIPGSFPPQ